MVPIKVDIEAESPAIRNEFFVDSISELLEYNFLYQSRVTPCQLVPYFEELNE